jgi:phosphoribosylformylglycinamidine synthase
MKITAEILAQHNLTDSEYQRIEELLGRTPSFTELGIFSVMWSEHCSYKSSRIHLGRLPTEGECLVQGPGENAGIVDIGDGWCAAFKIESHNHPSFIEPYQGAATGVGGILRDIFTMGARPVAAMNSLRFGPIREEDAGINTSEETVARNRRIMAGVVKGIGDYGNAFGVPTIGGEVQFAECYSLNPLVNAFALGLVRREQIFYGKAEGIGNAVIYVGAKTGRDGIHGATMASAEFDEAAMEKRPTVQVGDPFSEKLLLEACLEAMRAGAIVGIQDMGAAGLTSSSCEMGARAGTGIEIDLDLVPQRETEMTAYEMMLSESQERMLIVAERGRERQVHEIFGRWDLDAVTIGRVTDDQRLRVLHKGEVVADIPNAALTNEAPKYDRPRAESREQSDDDELDDRIAGTWGALCGEAGSSDQRRVLGNALRRLLSTPNLASKQWVWRQYDHMVRTNTVVLPGSDAAVIRVKETRRSLAMSLDGNGRYSSVDARAGARLAVAESARNVVCSGARPLAVTNCLNFASPERTDVMRSFSDTIDGIADACRALGTPVTGGNVSFYNETEGKGIYPTPVIGMLGVVEDSRYITTQWFKEPGDQILLLGQTGNDLGASEFLCSLGGVVAGSVPQLDMDMELFVQRACYRAIQAGSVRSAHDCSEGGLAVALAESCFAAPFGKALGARIRLDAHALLSGFLDDPIRNWLALLFGETPSRIILTCRPEDVRELAAIAQEEGAPCIVIGEVIENRLMIELARDVLIDESVAILQEAFVNSLPSVLDSRRNVAAEPA